MATCSPTHGPGIMTQWRSGGAMTSSTLLAPTLTTAAAAAALEAWATQRLEDMGVDGVFAPYVIGMLHDGDGATDDVDEIKFNVHQVLMGWLSPEDEERATAFVDELIKYHRNPSLVPVPTSSNSGEGGGVGHHATDGFGADGGDGDPDLGVFGSALGLGGGQLDAAELELKASAPLFVPGNGMVTSANGTEGDGSGSFDGTVDGEFLDESNDPPAVDVMQDEDTFFWSVAYDIVGHLQLKFPDVDPTRLCELLKLVELDADKAHAVIKATLERESVGTTQVCRHYLAGDCRRADCMFVHDTDEITCRFWLRGMCLQGENCVFAHGFTEFYALDQAAVKRDYDSEDEDDDASALNFDAEEMFPSLGAPAAKNAKEDSVKSLSLNFARAVSVTPPSAPMPAPLTFGSASSSESFGTRRGPLFSRPLHHKTSETVSGGRWFTTGSAVAAQYKQLREDAYEYACARNRCFMNATRAFQTGNKALARSLSAQGHEYNSKMKRCHFEAASQIFESRNPKSQVYNEQLMDLHGLHVTEAIELLTEMLPHLSNEGLESIHIVTGSGHHSKGATGNARLLPAVERFLATEGYRFNPVADRRGYVGMLSVDLRW